MSLVGWLVGRSVGRSVGRLVGWLVGVVGCYCRLMLVIIGGVMTVLVVAGCCCFFRVSCLPYTSMIDSLFCCWCVFSSNALNVFFIVFHDSNTVFSV